MHEGKQDPTELRILIDVCVSLNVISGPNGEIEVETQRCIGSVVDSLNKFGSITNFPDSIDAFK
jgi:hypothetical protein